MGFIWVCTDSTQVFEIGGFYLDFAHFTNLVQSGFMIIFGGFSRTENSLTLSEPAFFWVSHGPGGIRDIGAKHDFCDNFSEDYFEVHKSFCSSKFDD